MASSGETSRAIYEQLRAQGLAARTMPHWDERTVRLVQSMLEPRQRILDAGCGYGRIALPLAAADFEVVGIDISEHMLGEAELRAAEAGLKITWDLGDICELPYPDGSFDVVLCMWLTFNELLQRPEQLRALREMRRVLRPGGWALLDGPPFTETFEADTDPHPTDLASQESLVPGEGYVAAAFERLLTEVGITRYDLFVDDCPGRLRHFLRFWKPQ